MPERSFEHKDIVELLAKLKEETPEYPAKLVEARKESFLKQVLDISVSGGRGGEGGQDGGDDNPKGSSADSGESGGPGKAGKPAAPGDSSGSGGSSRPAGLSGSGGKGGSGAGLSSETTFLGFSMKSVIAFGAVVVLLTAAYLFRDQIVEYLAENEIISAEETAAPPFELSQSDQATETPPVVAAPDLEEPSSGIVATATAPGLGDNNDNSLGNGDNPDRAQEPPGQAVGSVTVTPTPGPPGDLGSAFRFLICILRMGGENCR